jgi:hypothetical protein
MSETGQRLDELPPAGAPQDADILPVVRDRDVLQQSWAQLRNAAASEVLATPYGARILGVSGHATD